LEKLSKRFNGRLRALGRLPHEELFKLRSKSWALLFPSIWEEAFGYAVLEAAATGTIPVAFRVGRVSEIIEGTQAERFLCEPNDAECLVKNVETVLALSPEELIGISTKLQEEVHRKFNLNNFEEKISGLFK